MKKRRIVKDDGRYLIYFAFEEESHPDTSRDTSADEEAESVHAAKKPENGERQ